MSLYQVTIYSSSIAGAQSRGGVKDCYTPPQNIEELGYNHD